MKDSDFPQIPTEMLNEKLEEVWEMCVFAEAKNEMSMAKLICCSIGGNDAIVGLQMPDEADHKQKMMRVIGLSLGKRTDLKCVAFFMVTEAWVSCIEKEQYSNMVERGIRPSQDPARKEVLMLASCSLDKREAFRCAEIVRGDGGERQFIKIDHMSSDFHDHGHESEIQMSMGSHMLPSLVESYAMSVIGRSQPALSAQIDGIIEESGLEMKSF